MISFRQAFIFSLTFHLLLMPGMGWLAGGWLKHEQPSQIIELELAAGAPGSAVNAGSAAAAGAENIPAGAALPLDASTPAVPEPEPLAEQTVASPLTDAANSAVPATAMSNQAVNGNSLSATGSGFGSAGGDQGGGGSAGTGNGGGGGGGSAATASVILPPRILERYEPEYPASARRANQEGVVRLRIQIQTNGLPGAIDIASSSGYQSLDLAAEQAVRNWRFVPARNSHSGAPVDSVTVLSVAFRLR